MLFVPTPDDVVEAMLNVASVGQGDVLYDLGSGDGRIPITAAQHYGIARGVGIDINPKRVKKANENRISAGVEARVTFINADLFEFDFSDATVVTLYQRELGQNRPQADARKRRSGAPNLRRRDRGLGTRNEEAKD